MDADGFPEDHLGGLLGIFPIEVEADAGDVQAVRAGEVERPVPPDLLEGVVVGALGALQEIPLLLGILLPDGHLEALEVVEGRLHLGAFSLDAPLVGLGPPMAQDGEEAIGLETMEFQVVQVVQARHGGGGQGEGGGGEEDGEEAFQGAGIW